MTFSRYALLCLCASFTAGAWAVDTAERHPIYDATTPRIPIIQPKATKLAITTATDKKLTVGSAYPFHQELTPEAMKLQGWRGERCSGQLAISTEYNSARISVRCTPLSQNGEEIPASVRMIRYVEAGGTITADVISSEDTCNHAVGVHRAVWYEVNIPQDAKPGRYTGIVTASAPGCKPVEQQVVLEVIDAELPAPRDWKIHLDLWQHPQAVARWHDVEMWSKPHFAIMRPLMKRLAEAGQKCITCTILDEAWNGQTYDWFPSMIRWVRGKDGVMRYDYSGLDAWIHFMHDDIGIREQISCYSMLPWHLKVKYFDETTGKWAEMKAVPGEPSFEQVWAPFLRDFHQHMKDKGWADKTCIAIDERPDEMVREAMRLVRENAPSFRIASAVDKPSELTREVYNISPVLTHAGSTMGALLRERKAAGKKTTFYVCMQPLVPNTYTTSAPAEATWLGLFAAANHLDGFLRWAYNSWTKNPLQSTDFGSWTTGDCFLVYPGNRTSIRFERLRDGIEEYEKINLLRTRASESPEAAAIIDSMDARLAAIFTVERSSRRSHAQDVQMARDIVTETLQALEALK